MRPAEHARRASEFRPGTGQTSPARIFADDRAPSSPWIGDLDAFQADLERFLAHARLLLAWEASGSYLRVPGHRPIAWAPTMSRRLFGAKRREKERQFYEETVTLLLSFLIGRLHPRTFLDIGASVGYFARVAAAHATHPPFVHAFEMRPDRLEEMRAAIARDGFEQRITVHHAGLSDCHDGERDFWFARAKLFEYEPQPHEYREAWWLRLKFFLRGRKDRGLAKVRALLTSIDHFVAEHGAVPQLVKIDVDGYEGKVLRGGLATFARYRPLIALELHRDKLLRFGDRRPDIVGILLDLGYRALFLTDHHDARACRIVRVDRDHPLVSRQETDFILFC